MKLRSLVPAFFALVSTTAVYADACMDMCKQKNRAAVQFCNYPEKEPKALRECLEQARRNFDACKQGCGK
jgi:hypothetical protein